MLPPRAESAAMKTALNRISRELLFVPIFQSGWSWREGWANKADGHHTGRTHSIVKR
jgi:hypothetical protein